MFCKNEFEKRCFQNFFDEKKKIFVANYFKFLNFILKQFGVIIILIFKSRTFTVISKLKSMQITYEDY